jgi:ATP dependent DNA ligase domain
MAATLARSPFHREGWIYEEKVDGWRMIAYKDGENVRLISRNAVDHTRRFPELVVGIAKLSPDTLVLDGEVAVFDEQLVSRFHLLVDSDTGKPARCCARSDFPSSRPQSGDGFLLAQHHPAASPFSVVMPKVVFDCRQPLHRRLPTLSHTSRATNFKVSSTRSGQSPVFLAMQYAHRVVPTIVRVTSPRSDSASTAASEPPATLRSLEERPPRASSVS